MAFEVTGNVRNRFVQAAVLLYLLDPVRGEPVAHGLDRDTNDIESSRDGLLKRKFLDSFALICAVRKDGDTVSAVCMEEGLPGATVIRVASNHGISMSTLKGLRDLMDILNNVATATSNPSDSEHEVLTKIIRLDMTRIRYYLKELRNANGVREASVVDLKSRMEGTLCSPSDQFALDTFSGWLSHIYAIRTMPAEPTPESLVDHIRWALEAKRTYFPCLRAAFSADTQNFPAWIYAILKLGRYAVAARALLQLALEVPSLFSPMLVEPVTAPSRTQFSIPEGQMPLTCVLRRVVGGREEEYIHRLGRVWNAPDPETHFRNACSLNLSVHAEVQLISFYDQHPERKPAFRFVGVSKKSCFLCEKFLANHPHAFTVSSCHRKLYLSWKPPPTVDHSAYKQYKTITTMLSKDMEGVAKQELNSRLGQRRSVPPDSTAGVSLSGLTDADYTGGGIQGDLVRAQATAVPERELSPITPSPQPIETIDLSPQDEDSYRASAETSLLWTTNSSLMMVFHVMRADDAKKQDIVALTDIMGPVTGSPSWSRFTEILASGGDLGVGFRVREEFLVVNEPSLASGSSSLVSSTCETQRC
ncbi:hypothetical protein FOQG_18430 [Fusarium oxysporum f. sp. raphani 54005]|uniref:Uncharacterized protein n=2 Tax=Fusarium oxysporum TaxID=5507 RepID=X0B3Y9_FUSOX|nr:hypothetical protein FOQG_18430 [Fusarium oxysporum f. sp. raphani 54005]EXL65797.1 hypothetical protein FOPG_18000 [Fusarium oxysporum f. sp. conglutinans race 2 54008]KAG6989511.1 hypothetical protein FocnCong_v020914 [Fusarium oxysporum f. sp. conglutinans]